MSLIVLAHGAGAGKDHPWMKRVADGLERHGIRVLRFNFPYMDRGRGAPDPGPVLEEAFASVWREAARSADGPMFAGGKSMGGRIASQAAARDLFVPPPAGLVYFGYPLHPPGKAAQRRDAHLPKITMPMLFLHGTRDPFGSPDEMRELAHGLPLATLEIIEGGDHSLVATKGSNPKGGSVDRAIEFAANWIEKLTARGARSRPASVQPPS